MNNIFRTIAGKVTIFIVCILSAAVFLGSVLGSFVMLEEGLYTRGEKAVYNDLILTDVAQLGEDLLYGKLRNYTPGGLENLQYILMESYLQTPIAASNDFQGQPDANTHWDFAIGYQYDADDDSIYWNVFNTRSSYTGRESFDSLFRQNWGYEYQDYLADIGYSQYIDQNGYPDEMLSASEEYYYSEEVEVEIESAEAAEAPEAAEVNEATDASDEAIVTGGADTIKSAAGEKADSKQETSEAASAQSSAASTDPSEVTDVPETTTVVTEEISSYDVFQDPHSIQYLIENGYFPHRSTYVFFANVNTAFPGPTDTLELTYNLIHFVFQLRYHLLPIAGGSFLLALISFILLLSVSGRRRGSNELFPGPMHKVPADLMFFGYIIAFCVLLILFEELRSMILAIAASLWCIILMGLFLGLCMNFAVKIKGHCFWKTTLIGRFCLLIASTFRRIKVVPRLSLLLFGILFIQFLVLMMTRSGEYMVFWFMECLFLIPLALYFAVNLKDLENAGKHMASGDFSQKVNPKKLLPFLRPHAHALNSLGDGMTIAVENQLKSERMKTELITNVSHDLKTPLTSIINYANLIANEPTDNEKITEYSEVLVRQSTKLKRLIEDLVEASKAATGNLEVELAPCDASVFVTQTVGEFEDRLTSSNLTLVTSLPEEEVRIMADGRRMWRIFDNLMNNACKYALPGTRVYLSLEKFNQNAVIIFKNISKEPLNMSEEALMERFTRGDSSRNTEGNGLGLSIAKSMAELQNGRLHVSIDGDLFKATLLFPLLDPAVQNLQIPESQETTDPDFDFRPLS